MIGKVLIILCVCKGDNCAHPEDSARRCAFLSLVLSAAGSQFHAFRSGAQTHRLGSKNIEPM